VDDAWLPVREAADRCGVTYRTIYRMVRSGELLARKPYRLRRIDVDTFVERSRVRPGEFGHLHRLRVDGPKSAPGATSS
jgi:excisionase family DNA binding protein